MLFPQLKEDGEMVGLAIAPYHKNGEKEQQHLVTLTDELLWSSALLDVSRLNLIYVSR
jgi:hypothetical protein